MASQGSAIVHTYIYTFMAIGIAVGFILHHNCKQSFYVCITNKYSVESTQQLRP